LPLQDCTHEQSQPLISTASLLVINTSDIDFVHRREDLDDLTTQVLNMKQGTRYYVPLREPGAPFLTGALPMRRATAVERP
jgi:hypothetical protein